MVLCQWHSIAYFLAVDFPVKADISDLLSRSPALELAMELPGDEMGQNGTRTKGSQDIQDPGQSGSRTKGIQDNRDQGQYGSKTIRIQDNRDPGQ